MHADKIHTAGHEVANPKMLKNPSLRTGRKWIDKKYQNVMPDTIGLALIQNGSETIVANNTNKKTTRLPGVTIYLEAQFRRFQKTKS